MWLTPGEISDMDHDVETGPGVTRVMIQHFSYKPSHALSSALRPGEKGVLGLYVTGSGGPPGWLQAGPGTPAQEDIGRRGGGRQVGRHDHGGSLVERERRHQQPPVPDRDQVGDPVARLLLQ